MEDWQLPEGYSLKKETAPYLVEKSKSRIVYILFRDGMPVFFLWDKTSQEDLDKTIAKLEGNIKED